MSESEGESGAVRWAFNFGAWNPTEEEWQQALSLIEPVERERVGRFRRPTNPPLVGRTNPDAKSALVGRLLLRLLVHEVLSIPFSEISFARTKEGKPYLVNKSDKFPNFNFNISHSGNWVILGSEPEDIIGVDVMEAKVNPRQTVDKFFSDLAPNFTPKEWSAIRSSQDKQKQVAQFFRHWCLKEAYIKAVGIGLGFELLRAQFTLDNNEKATSAVIAIDGQARPEWKFDIHYLDEEHIAACSLGPPEEALSFQKTMVTPESKGTAVGKHLHTPFQVLKIQELVVI